MEKLTQTFTPTHLPEMLSEFVSADYPPQDDKPVLCIKRTDHFAPCQYELLTASYDTEYRAWRDVRRQLVVGNPILGWKQALRWLQVL